MKDNHYVMLRRPDGYWYYYVWRWGKRVYRSTGEKRKCDAIEVINDRVLRGDLLNEHKDVRPKTFEEFSEPFWIYETCPVVQDRIKRGGHYTRAFCENNRRTLEKYLLPAFGKKLLPEITPSIINRYLYSLPEKYGITPQTANKTLYVLRMMMDEAVAQNLIKENPARNIKQLFEKPLGRGCFSVEQVAKIFSEPWFDPLAELACRLAATTGMREGEIRALSHEQLKDGYILVDRSYSSEDGLKCTKSGNPRVVPVLPELMERLKNAPKTAPFVFSYKNGNPIGKSALLRKLKARMEECGIDYRAENLTFHSFRHFFNTRLVADGVDLEHIRSVIGHESEQMTEHYLHLTVSDMETIRKVQSKIFA